MSYSDNKWPFLGVFLEGHFAKSLMFLGSGSVLFASLRSHINFIEKRKKYRERGNSAKFLILILFALSRMVLN